MIRGIKHNRAWYLFGLMLIAWGCQPAFKPTPFVLQKPEAFPIPVIPDSNQLTVEGIALGRKLFFDPILSKDKKQSCSSCHLPGRGFGDHRALSVGVHGLPGKRNALPLANMAWFYKGLFWDGRAATLEQQALMPVEDSLEMAAEWTVVERRLQQHAEYPLLFKQAFGLRKGEEIDRYLVAKALAQYERTLVSANAKYDQVMAGKAEFTASEARGKTIFFDSSEEMPQGECANCHNPPLFTDLRFLNNGLDPVADLEDYPDKGRGAVNGKKYDNGRFRVPSLRNIARTAPYMHDGRFKTLEEVLEHYNSGGHFSENVDAKIKPLQLSEQDKADLIAFLNTLTDFDF